MTMHIDNTELVEQAAKLYQEAFWHADNRHAGVPNLQDLGLTPLKGAMSEMKRALEIRARINKLQGEIQQIQEHLHIACEVSHYQELVSQARTSFDRSQSACQELRKLAED